VTTFVTKMIFFTIVSCSHFLWQHHISIGTLFVTKWTLSQKIYNVSFFFSCSDFSFPLIIVNNFHLILLSSCGLCKCKICDLKLCVIIVCNTDFQVIWAKIVELCSRILLGSFGTIYFIKKIIIYIHTIRMIQVNERV